MFMSFEVLKVVAICIIIFAFVALPIIVILTIKAIIQLSIFLLEDVLFKERFQSPK